MPILKGKLDAHEMVGNGRMFPSYSCLLQMASNVGKSAHSFAPHFIASYL